MEIFLHNAPLVRIIVPLILGLSTALRFDLFSEMKVICMIGVLITVGMLFSLDDVWKKMSKNHYFGFLSSITFFLLGIALGFRDSDDQNALIPGKSYLAIVETLPVEKANSYAVNLKVIHVQIDSQRYQSCSFRIIAYMSKEGFDPRIFPGETLKFSDVSVNKERQLYPYQFDYQQYLRNTGISGSVYIPSWSYELIELEGFSLRSQLNGFRANLLERLNEDSISAKEFGVISALLVGDRSFLDPQLRDDFADAGAVHILAVSGLHVGIIYLLFLNLFNFLFKKKANLLKFLMVLAILWAYAALTGFSPSVLRASTMFSFIALGKYHKQYGNIYNMIAASALFLLIIDPLLLTQIGFQLSYLAVLGIVFFFPKFHGMMIVENKYLDKLWSLICVSVAAQLATFPLSVYYFNQFPSFFLFTNVLVIPLASIILHVGVAWIFLLWIPYVSDILGWITVKAAWILNLTVETVNTIPFAKIEGIYLTGLSVATLYLIIVLVAIFFEQPSRRSLRLLGLAVALFAGMIIHRRLNFILQDEVLFPTLSNRPTIVRLVQDNMYVFTGDSIAFKANWQREIYPYLLSRGVGLTDQIHFVNYDDEESIMCIRNAYSSQTDSHVFWNLRSKVLRVNTIVKGPQQFSEAETPILQLKAKDLTRFSTDLLLLQK